MAMHLWYSVAEHSGLAEKCSPQGLLFEHFVIAGGVIWGGHGIFKT